MNATRWKIACALTLIVGFGCVLRGWNLARETPWLDEVFVLSHAGTPSLAEFWKTTPPDDNGTRLTPLFYTLLYGWGKLSGNQTLWWRLPSLAAGLLSVAAVYALGRRMDGVRAGLWAAAMMAVALPQVYYSQEIRRYAFDGLLVLASFQLLLHAAQAPHQKRRWAALLLFNAVLPWSCPHALPLFAVQGVFLVSRLKRPCLGWWAFHGLATGLYYLQTRTVNLDAHAWMGPPNLGHLLNTLLMFAGGRAGNENPGPFLPGGHSFDVPLGLAVYALAAWGAVCLWRRGEGRNLVLLLAGWLLFPMAFWWVYSRTLLPCYLQRYLLFSAPALFLLAGAGWAGLRWPRARAAMALAFAAGYAFQVSVVLAGPFRPDYRAAARYIADEPDQSPVLVHKQLLNAFPFAYNAPQLVSRVVVSYGQGDLDEKAAALNHRGRPYWVLFWRWDRLPEFEAFTLGQQAHFERHSLGGMPPLLLYRVSPGAGGPSS